MNSTKQLKQDLTLEQARNLLDANKSNILLKTKSTANTINTQKTGSQVN